MKSIAACFKNEAGELLMYTVQSTLQQCEEFCQASWGSKGYDALCGLGGRVVQIEVKELGMTFTESASGVEQHEQ